MNSESESTLYYIERFRTDSPDRLLIGSNKMKPEETAQMN